MTSDRETKNGPRVDADRLRNLLGSPALKRLLDRLQHRVERGRELGSPIQLSGATEEERRAVATLLGRPGGRGNSLRVDPTAVEEVLRRCGAAGDLRSALDVLRGPLRDRRAEREGTRALWEELLGDFEEESCALGLDQWLERLRTGGLLKRLAGGDAGRGRALLRQALLVAARLPARGISRSRLAAETLGDAHALDPGRPAGTLVCRALATRCRLPEEQSPEGVRDLWAAGGVLVGGAITSTVLVLNLPALPETSTGKALAGFAATGEPAWLTLRQLLRSPPSFEADDRDIFVCENPAVVAEAAEELGAASPPILCTSGQRNSAVSTLLRLLCAAGARLHYHGDFDWDGLVIANGIMTRHGARPWRYGTGDYTRAVPSSSSPLAGKPVEALWDHALAPAMAQMGFAVHEEQVLGDLLEDLRLRPPEKA